MEEMSSGVPLWSPELNVIGVPQCWFCGSYFQDKADYCACTGVWGWTLAQLAARICFLQWLSVIEGRALS